jgi:hypothetical protein
MTAQSTNDTRTELENAELGIDNDTAAGLIDEGQDAITNDAEIASLAEQLDKLDGLKDGMVGDLPVAEVIGDILDIFGLTGSQIHDYVVSKFGEDAVQAAFTAAETGVYGEDGASFDNLSEVGEDDLDSEEFASFMTAMMGGLFGNSAGSEGGMGLDGLDEEELLLDEGDGSEA